MQCNALQHTATHCNTLQRTATHCNTTVLMLSIKYSLNDHSISTVVLQCVAVRCSVLQCVALCIQTTYTVNEEVYTQ